MTKKNQILRDHMTDLELIFTMLGERVTTEVSQKEKPTAISSTRIPIAFSSAALTKNNPVMLNNVILNKAASK